MLKTAARALDTGGNGLKDFRKTRRKRIEAWLTAAMFLFGTLTGCGSVSDTHGDVGTPNDGKLKVVTTLFPYYDFTRQIAGDAVDLSMVIPAGQDSHSFEPTPADIRLIQNADLLICNGGAMEQWVSQVVASLDSESLKVITMMDYVDTVEEEIVEGMEDAGEEHHHFPRYSPYYLQSMNFVHKPGKYHTFRSQDLYGTVCPSRKYLKPKKVRACRRSSIMPAEPDIF